MVILAGGDGKRLREFTRNRFGTDLPKQFCNFGASESLVQQTFRRVTKLVPPERTVVSISAAHMKLAAEQLSDYPVHFVVQPVNKDTTAAIFLSLIYVYNHDPGATVVFVPSDHYIMPAKAFEKSVLRAIAIIAANDDQIVVLGIKPTYDDKDYGFIIPAPRHKTSRNVDGLPVASILEKPDDMEYRWIQSKSFYWNTFIMVGKVASFWKAGWETAPQIMNSMEELRLAATGTSTGYGTAEKIFNRLPTGNFTRDVLQSIPEYLRLVPMDSCRWFDLGRPERVKRAFNSIPNGDRSTGRPHAG